MENNLASVSMATHAMLTKLIVELKADGSLTEQQIARAITSARKVLEEDGDLVGLRAGLLLENLHDELVPESEQGGEKPKAHSARDQALLNLASWAERLEGQAYADRVIQDALVVTVLQSAPHLVEVMARNLQMRYDQMPASMRGDPLKWFQQRIAEMRTLVESQSRKP